MKFYIINEIDAQYHQLGGNLRTLAGAFLSRENAQAECDRLNSETSDEWDGHYEVAEVEVESYVAAREQAKVAKERALEATRAAFVAGCHELFETYPDLQSFGWKQYVRYFSKEGISDFSVHSDEPAINGIGGYEVDDGLSYDAVTGKTVQVREPSVESELQDSVAAFLKTFHDDDMHALFGEDVIVTVRREGTIETEDCPGRCYWDDEDDYDDTDEDYED
jgi:hypothetical protein